MAKKIYRTSLTGYDRGALNDAPILKALLYLLTQDVFKGSWLGSRDKDNIELWQQVLSVAARQSAHERRRRRLTPAALEEYLAARPASTVRLADDPERRAAGLRAGGKMAASH